MAVFSMAVFKNLRMPAPAEIARDFLILFYLLFCVIKLIYSLCSGAAESKLPQLLDTIISALVLTRLTNFIREFFARIRISD